MELSDRRLRTPEAASFVGLSPRTLEQMRFLGTGPAFVRSGRRLIVYRIEDLEVWRKTRERLHQSTSDTGSPIADKEAAPASTT